MAPGTEGAEHEPAKVFRLRTLRNPQTSTASVSASEALKNDAREHGAVTATKRRRDFWVHVHVVCAPGLQVLVNHNKCTFRGGLVGAGTPLEAIEEWDVGVDSALTLEDERERGVCCRRTTGSWCAGLGSWDGALQLACRRAQPCVVHHGAYFAEWTVPHHIPPKLSRLVR